MLSILVYSSSGDFIHRCDINDMQELFKVFRTELLPRYSDESFEVSISGEILLVEPVKGPPSVAPLLTERQRQILQLMARSFAPKQIASELAISEATVRMHINALKKRFNAESRDQLMAIVGALELCNPFDPGNGSQVEQPGDGAAQSSTGAEWSGIRNAKASARHLCFGIMRFPASWTWLSWTEGKTSCQT